MEFECTKVLPAAMNIMTQLRWDEQMDEQMSNLFQKIMQYVEHFCASCIYHTPLAHLVVHRAVAREVVSLRLLPDHHSGSLNN